MDALVLAALVLAALVLAALVLAALVLAAGAGRPVLVDRRAYSPGSTRLQPREPMLRVTRAG